MPISQAAEVIKAIIGSASVYEVRRGPKVYAIRLIDESIEDVIPFNYFLGRRTLSALQ